MRALVATLALLSLADQAVAQLTSDRDAFADFRPFLSAGAQFQCGSTNSIITGAGLSAIECTGAGADYSATSLVEDGAVHVRSFVGSSALTATGREAGWAAVAGGTWGDRLLFSGGQASSVDLTLSWTGKISSSVGGAQGALAEGSAGWSFLARGALGDLARYNNNAQTFARWDVGLTDEALIDDTQIFHLALAGLSYVDFQYRINTSVDLGDFIAAAGEVFSGQSDADFLNTGKITGLVFRDQAGNDVTAATTFSFVNGTQIYPGDVTSITPEPATILLMATGLAGLAGVVRRRRTV